MSSPAHSGRRYGGQTAEERGLERRRRLLDAGLELFGSIGYGATTIEMLCAASRLNPRYFYEEFGTREALLRAVYDRHVEAVRDAVLGALAKAPAAPRERLESGLRAFIAAVLADPRAARINYFEILGVSQELEARRREVLRFYAELIAAEIAALDPGRRPGAEDLRLTAVAFVSATDGLIIDALASREPVDAERIVGTLVDIFLAPERPFPPPGRKPSEGRGRTRGGRGQLPPVS